MQLLRLMGPAWPAGYAVCYSAKTLSFYLLAKSDTPLSVPDAKEAHRKLYGQEQGAYKYRKKEDRQKFPLEQRLQVLLTRAHEGEGGLH